MKQQNVFFLILILFSSSIQAMKSDLPEHLNTLESALQTLYNRLTGRPDKPTAPTKPTKTTRKEIIKPELRNLVNNIKNDIHLTLPKIRVDLPDQFFEGLNNNQLETIQDVITNILLARVYEKPSVTELKNTLQFVDKDKLAQVKEFFTKTLITIKDPSALYTKLATAIREYLELEKPKEVGDVSQIRKNLKKIAENTQPKSIEEAQLNLEKDNLYNTIQNLPLNTVEQLRDSIFMYQNFYNALNLIVVKKYLEKGFKKIFSFDFERKKEFETPEAISSITDLNKIGMLQALANYNPKILQEQLKKYNKYIVPIKFANNISSQLSQQARNELEKNSIVSIEDARKIIPSAIEAARATSISLYYLDIPNTGLIPTTKPQPSRTDIKMQKNPLEGSLTTKYNPSFEELSKEEKVTTLNFAIAFIIERFNYYIDKETNTKRKDLLAQSRDNIVEALIGKLIEVETPEEIEKEEIKPTLIEDEKVKSELEKVNEKINKATSIKKKIDKGETISKEDQTIYANSFAEIYEILKREAEAYSKNPNQWLENQKPGAVKSTWLPLIKKYKYLAANNPREVEELMGKKVREKLEELKLKKEIIEKISKRILNNKILAFELNIQIEDVN